MKNSGLILIIIGVLLLLSSLGLVAYNLYEDYQASVVSCNTVNKIIDHIDSIRDGNDKKDPSSSVNDVESNVSNNDENTHTTNPGVPEYIINPDIEMPSVLIDGEYYIGLLEIPSLELSLPINSEWSYRKLKHTPCRYTGTAYKRNFVIAAHNYNSHFGSIKQLQQGDLVYFTDMSGNRFTYSVDVCETLIPTAVEEMTSGEWALSLFTCTPGGANRVTVRCELVK